MAERDASPTRLTAFFAGTVQGVGFRYTTRRIAGGFRVAGFVRNLPDGRVELVAEGACDEVSRFQQAVEQEMRSYIREVQATHDPPTGEFASFSIAF